MLVLIPAGGKGTRLNRGEKPLVRLCGHPLISYVINAIAKSGHEIVVLTSPNTPYTANYCRMNSIDQICCSGMGYLEDINEAIQIIGESEPFITICADLPGITKEHIRLIIDAFRSSGSEALSAWVPAACFLPFNLPVLETIDIQDTPAIPIGMNIMSPSPNMHRQLNEKQILIDDPALVFNINSQTELKIAEIYFSERKSISGKILKNQSSYT